MLLIKKRKKQKYQMIELILFIDRSKKGNISYHNKNETLLLSLVFIISGLFFFQIFHKS